MAQERTEAQKIASGEIEKKPICSDLPSSKFIAPRYTVNFSCDTNTPQTLSIEVTWPSLSGGIEKTYMYYRAGP